jgi:hypothetical protein
VGFDVLTTYQLSTVWCSGERLPAAAAQPAKVRQSCSATDYNSIKHLTNLFIGETLSSLEDDYEDACHLGYCTM